MLLVILRIVLFLVVVRFVLRLVRWMTRPQGPRPVESLREGRARKDRPRIVDVDFTEERPGKERR